MQFLCLSLICLTRAIISTILQQLILHYASCLYFKFPLWLLPLPPLSVLCHLSFCFSFSPFDCIFLQKLFSTNNFMLLYFVITHFFEKVLQRSLYYFAAMQQQITKNFRVFLNCFKHRMKKCGLGVIYEVYQK